MVHGGNDFSALVALGKLRDDFSDTRQRHRILCGPHRQRLSHSSLLLASPFVR
jgi:hypothetical protein